jgi:hypothetical protein
MKKILFLISLSACIIFISCEKKTRNVHFHGRAYVDCDDSPVVNEEVKIIVVFAAGMTSADEVARTRTDGAGNYSVTANVSYPGSFERYSASFTNIGKYPGSAISYDTEGKHEVHMDMPTSQNSKVNFHFKNNTPVDDNDLLYCLSTSPDSTVPDGCLTLNLQGTNVDTIISLVRNPGRIYYKYTYRKNGNYNDSPVMFFDMECRTDINVDAFY